MSREIDPSYQGRHFILSASEKELFGNPTEALNTKIKEKKLRISTNTVLATVGIPLTLSGLGLLTSSLPAKNVDNALGGLFLFTTGMHLMRSLGSGLQRLAVLDEEIKAINNFLDSF